MKFLGRLSPPRHKILAPPLLTSSTGKPQRNRKFVYRNKRIIDLMDRYGEDRLSLIEYFDKISQTIGKK